MERSGEKWMLAADQTEDTARTIVPRSWIALFFIQTNQMFWKRTTPIRKNWLRWYSLWCRVLRNGKDNHGKYFSRSTSLRCANQLQVLVTIITRRERNFFWREVFRLPSTFFKCLQKCWLILMLTGQWQLLLVKGSWTSTVITMQAHRKTAVARTPNPLPKKIKRISQIMGPQVQWSHEVDCCDSHRTATIRVTLKIILFRWT